MPNKRANGKRKIGTWLESDVADLFANITTQKGEDMAAVLRQMIWDYVNNPSLQSEKDEKADTNPTGTEPVRKIRKKGKR
jgi:hypothetical protein